MSLRIGLAILALALLIAGCGAQLGLPTSSLGADNGGSNSPTFSDQSISHFASTVYPIARDHCGQCHYKGNTSPFFANQIGTTAIEDSYDALLAGHKVDLQNPSQSRIYQKLNEFHNCWSSCPSDAAAMLAAIQQWKNLDGVGNSGFNGIKTLAVTIPSTTNSSTTVTMNISIRELNTNLIPAGSVLSIDVKLDANRQNYIFSNPRITMMSRTPSIAIQLASWALFVNTSDVTSNNTLYSVLTQSFSTNGLSINLSYRGSPMSNVTTPKASGPGVDTLSLGVVSISQRSASEVRFQAFQDAITGCTGCHAQERTVNAGIVGSERIVPAFGDSALFQTAQNYAQTRNGRRLVEPGNPEGSWLYQVVVVGRTIDGTNYPSTIGTDPTAYRLMPPSPNSRLGSTLTNPNDPLYKIRDFILNFNQP